MLILTYISEKINQRALLGVIVQIWFLPCTIALAVLPADVNRWAMYAVVTVLLSYPTPHPMQVGWTSRNSNAVRTRTVSAALYNISVQLSSIISANIYREDDRPEYRRGNRALVAIGVLNIFIYLGAKGYYIWRNKQKSQAWESLNTEERVKYMEDTRDQGSKAKNVTFVH